MLWLPESCGYSFGEAQLPLLQWHCRVSSVGSQPATTGSSVCGCCHRFCCVGRAEDVSPGLPCGLNCGHWPIYKHMSILFESHLHCSVLHVSDLTWSVLPVSGVHFMLLLLSCYPCHPALSPVPCSMIPELIAILVCVAQPQHVSFEPAWAILEHELAAQIHLSMKHYFAQLKQMEPDNAFRPNTLVRFQHCFSTWLFGPS